MRIGQCRRALLTTFQGNAQAFQASLSGQPVLILAAVVAVYIILGVLYESLVHPITILSTIPSAGVGAPSRTHLDAWFVQGERLSPPYTGERGAPAGSVILLHAGSHDAASRSRQLFNRIIGSDADLLREMIGLTAQRPMELEVATLTGAGHDERSLVWINWHNGYCA